MNLLAFGLSSSPVAEGIATVAGISLGEREIERLPDGELQLELAETVRGHDIFQSRAPVER
jgi:phosphoribosylpyrophosphate synthetase